MKIRFSILFVLLCLNASLNAQAIYKKNSVQYPGVEEKRTYHLYNKKKNPNCHIKINFFYPEFNTQNAVAQKIQSIFISDFFGQKYASFSPKEAAKIYAEAYIETYKNRFERSGAYVEEVEMIKGDEESERDLNALYTQEKIMRNTIFLNQGEIISQVINVYEYTGGAHGSAYSHGSVLDLQTGEKIKYEDIFYENTQEAISKLLYANLMLERKYKSPEEMTADGFDFDIISPTDNFVVSSEGVTFIYNPYELGAYVLGIIEINVPYSDLVYYMKPKGTLFRWAEIRHAGNQIQFETAVLQQDQTLIHFVFPNIYHNSSVLKKLQKVFIENAFGKDFNSLQPVDAPVAFYEKRIRESAVNVGFSQKNTFHYNWNDLISYTIENSGQLKGFVVDIQTVKNLTYNDLFRPESRNEMTRLLKNKPTDNFYVDGTGITFIYAPDLTVTFSYAEIMPHLRPNSPLLRNNND